MAGVLIISACGSGSAEPKMTATYESAASGDAITGRTLMMRAHLLENLVEKVNGTLNLPHDIALVGAQCGEPNAYWNFAEKKITLCYEDADLSLRNFKAIGDPDPILAAVNATRATFYHELAHAAIDFGVLPITGREEDASDQLVVFLLLAPDENGNVEPGAEDAVLDYARMFDHYDETSGDHLEVDFASKHPSNHSRMYNMLCWTYGSNPAKHAHLVTGDVDAKVSSERPNLEEWLLPESRAKSCADEYAMMARSWSELLAPYEKSE